MAWRHHDVFVLEMVEAMLDDEILFSKPEKSRDYTKHFLNPPSGSWRKEVQNQSTVISLIIYTFPLTI